MEAARPHLGIAFVVRRLVSADLVNGTLVAVLPEVLGSRERLCLTYPDKTFLDPKVCAYVDFVAARIKHLRGG